MVFSSSIRKVQILKLCDLYNTCVDFREYRIPTGDLHEFQ